MGIPNPDYVEDDFVYKYDDFGFVGFDLWQGKGGTIFDNIIICDEDADADAFAAKGKKLNEFEKAKEKEAKDEEDARREAAKKEDDAADDDDDDDEDEEEDEKDEEM